MRVAILISALLSALCSLCCSAQEAPPSFAGTPTPARSARDRAASDLAGDDSAARIRAADELAQIAKSDHSVAAPLLAALFVPPRDGSLIEWDIAKALLNVSTLTGADVISAYEKSGASIDLAYELLVVTLGRMGPRARDAQGFLSAQLEGPGLNPRREGQTLVALACIGKVDAGAIQAIRAGLVSQDELGAGAVSVMGRVRTDAWATEDIVAALATWLPFREPRYPDGPAYAAAALGLLGERGRPARDALKRQVALIDDDPDIGGYAVLYGIALARVDSRERAAALRHVLKLAGSEAGASRLVAAALRDTADFIEPDFLADVVGMLDDNDDEVVVGALRLLSCVGLSAGVAAPGVARLNAASSSDAVRSQAAETLARIALDDVP